MSVLEDRERARLAILTACPEADLERILAVAAAEGIILILPAFSTATDFHGWEAFRYDGHAKSAHLIERDATRALCGAPRPGTHVVATDARVRVCAGCAARAEELRDHPHRLKRYDRGSPPAVRTVAAEGIFAEDYTPSRSSGGAPSRREQEQDRTETPSAITRPERKRRPDAKAETPALGLFGTDRLPVPSPRR